MKPKAKTSIVNLFTRETENAGIDFELTFPDGSKVPEKIRIVSSSSDRFVAGRALRSQESARILSLPKDKQAPANYEADTALMASCVIGWEFAEECSPGNVRKLLTEAPWVREQVDRAIADKRLFFVRKP
jgi:hypothetical protein